MAAVYGHQYLCETKNVSVYLNSFVLFAIKQQTTAVYSP